jgi:glycerophosphoryl diester phosphodiesterase
VTVPAPGERPGPRIIGHRGAALSAPENTLAGFLMAAALGVSWVEFDVRLSRDGRCILLHDDSLDRTTNGQGPAASCDFAEIRRLDAGTWFGPEFRGQRVPSLEETIDLLAELKLGAVVELKPAPGAESATGHAAAALLAERWPAQQPPPILSSFKPAALAAARDAAPHFARALLLGPVARDWRQQMDALDCSLLNADQRRLDRAIVESVRAAGIPLFAYTVNTADRAAKLFAWGVEAVFSDCPGRLARELAPA